MEHSLRRYTGPLAVDPSGAVADALRWIPRYRPAVEQRHAAFMLHWRAGEHDAALVELHLFLTAASRTIAFMQMAGERMGGEVKSHVGSLDFTLLKDARNHFEHIEDRLYGSMRNQPQPITEGGATRTVHFGLRGSDQHFTFGDKALDVSPNFLMEFLSFVDRFLALVDETFVAASHNPPDGSDRA